MKKPFDQLRKSLQREDQEQPFLEHLEAFRQMIFRCIIATAITTLICIPLAQPILRWLQEPLLQTAEAKGHSFELITTSPVEGFVQVVKVVFASGVLISLPLLIFFIAQFVVPGLRPKERRLLAIGGLAGAVLFATGVALCYTISLPVAVNIMFYFNDYLGTAANWKIEKYLGFVMHLLIGFGLAFELPLILIMSGRMGFVNTQQLRRHRKHVFVGILVLAMMLTPPDIITQLQMAIPLYLLYEICILILRLLDRRTTSPENKERGS
jgi:sec-independent protein translocase protein TatC